MKVFRTLGIALVAVLAWTSLASSQAPFTAGTWTKVTNTPASAVAHMLLLTDGRVLVHEEPNCSGNGCSGMDYTAWFVLTPDATGSYINGTWSQVGSMPPNYAPLYFGWPQAVYPQDTTRCISPPRSCPAVM